MSSPSLAGQPPRPQMNVGYVILIVPVAALR